MNIEENPAPLNTTSNDAHTARLNSILLVDDSATIRKHLTRTLENAGYAVTAVASGTAALDFYKQGRTALVILDIVMPEMDGLETFQSLRALDNQVKVIGISGLGSRIPEEYLKILRKLGAIAVLKKPFPDEALIRIVNHFLGPNPCPPNARPV